VPIFAITYIFDIPGHGFSETHYKSFTSDNLDSARDVAVELGQRRMAMAGEQCVLQAIRISNAEDPGRVGKTYYQGIVGVTGKGCMASNVALNIITGNFNNTANSLTQFRGCWDEVELNGGAFDRGNTAFITAFNSWAQYFIQQGFGWRSISATTSRVVTNYIINPTTMIVTVTHDGAALPFGGVGVRKTARFSKVNGKSKLNGTQVIVVVGDNTVSLVKPLALAPFQTPGTINVNAYTFIAAQNATIQRIGKRQAGAPLLRAPGRQPARPRV